MKKLVALLAAAFSGALTLIAATPAVVWDCAVSGMELDTMQGGLTISLNGNSIDDGKIVIGDSAYGAYIQMPVATNKVSVLVKYSNGAAFNEGVSGNIYLATVLDSTNNELGILNKTTAPDYMGFYYVQNGNLTWEGFQPFIPESGYMLFSYGTDSEGLRFSSGTTISSMTSRDKSAYRFSSNSQTIQKVSIGGSSQFSPGWKGLLIEKVALFVGEALSATDVADYKFPSTITTDTTVSAINSSFGSASEIDIDLADGVTVTGDEAFNASTVHFHCDGSFNLKPPAGNAAAFDFSGVTGAPVLIYDGELPTVSGNTFTSNSIPTFVTDSGQWTGTIGLQNIAGIRNLQPDNYGNAASTLRLMNLSGYFAENFTANVQIELQDGSAGYGFKVTDGYSRDDNHQNRVSTICTLKGNGSLWTGEGTASTMLFNVLDWSGYTGSIQLAKHIIVFGSEVPSFSTFNIVGGIYIGSDATVTLAAQWRADGGILVHGTLKADTIEKFRAAETANNIPATRVATSDSGKIVLTNSANFSGEESVDFSRISGTGTLRFESSGNFYRVLSKVNFPTNMTVEAEVQDSIAIPNVDGMYTIGSLSGSKGIRSDWNAGNRDLRILQAKDTTWSGVFRNNDRLKNVIVAPGVSSAGMLTLSGTQTADNDLVVESGAAVNLTGSWIGAATVAGTFGGTGTLTGDLALSDGATIKVNGSEPLKVTGDVALSGDIAIVVADDVDVSRLTILRVTGDDATLDVSAVSSFTARKASGKTILANVVAMGKELRLFKVGFNIRLK